MDWNVRFTTAMVALFGSLSLFVVGLWWALGQSNPPILDIPPVTQATPSRATTRSVPHARGLDAMRASARISELEEQNRRSERLVVAKNRALDELRAEADELRSQLRASEEFANLLVNAAQDATPGVPSGIPKFTASEPAESLLSVTDPMPETVIDAPVELEEPQAPTAAQIQIQQLKMQLADREADLALERLAKTESMQAIGAPAVNGLIRALESRRAEVRAWACDAIATLGLEASEAYGAVEPLLNDPSPRVRDQAAIALRSIRE